MAVAVPWIVASAAAVSAVGAIQQGKAASDAANYNAEIARQNAAQTEAQAEAADQALKRTQEQRMGAAIAEIGAAGVGGSSGSPLDVLTESARQATLDRLTQRYNYRLKALGYRDQADLDAANASNYKTAGYFNANAAVLQGATSLTGVKFGG